MPSNNAKYCKNYRNRKKNATLKIQKTSLTSAERSRMYRLRKIQLSQGIQSSVNEAPLTTPSTSNSRMAFEPSPQPVTTEHFANMEETNKVFNSAIIRTGQHHKNNLYDLLKIIPAVPLECNNVKTYTCDFKPRTDKIYVPKRRPKAKVKTVRDIRTSFENETYTFLTRDLETQQNYLLKKIRVGSSKNQNTQNIAKKILKSDSPISRSTWQMLVNLNPDHEIHPQQFVLWNGNFLQVNGSKGGNNKLICNYDLANMKIPLQVKNKIIKNKKNNKRSGLLRNSLAIKFKPGPLGRKKFLDDSHQKYQGDVELVDLPKVGLVVKPTYGTPLEATISNFVSIVCKDDGIISERWAEFAVSVLGKIDKSDVRLVNGDCVTFDLKYKYDQHRLLMRKDLDSKYFTPSVTETSTVNKSIGKAQPNILPDIEDMMDKIINAVEININQNSMFSEDDDSRQTVLKVSNPVDSVTVSKDKTKRKYSELDRLDVTVIRIPENLEKDSTQSCGNMHCTLGCICDAIKNTYYIKQHCGREECMFNCKCDFSKYSNINFLDMNGSDSIELIPGIKNIEDKLNTRLAKEEQKFHQTVIVSGEKNILLKSEKRSWKSSKKYGTFYKHMCLKNVNPGNRILSISALRLNCENVEPWCMVHNLYKCFCKGKITTSNASSIFQTLTQEPIYKDPDVECRPKIQRKNDPELSTKPLPRLRRHNVVNLDGPGKDFVSGKTSDVSRFNSARKQKTRNISDIFSNHQRLSSTSEIFDSFNNENKADVSISDSSDSNESSYSDNNCICSRVIGYEGRKYSNEHYQVINYKIKNLEKNDKMLKKKIMSILNPKVLKVNTLLEEKQHEQDKVKQKTSVKDLETDLHKDNTHTGGIQKDNISTEAISKDQNQNKFYFDVNGAIGEDKTKNKLRCTEKKLVEWLETNYKLYKKRVDEGLITTSLEPPRVGKITLHPWDFILSRYRERKNLFLISKQKPYRIFMGVHTRNPFFESCININEIHFADLHKYPQTVQNLLTNATHLKDLFCILRGLAHCWELAGSVAKVSKSDDNTDDMNDVISDTNSNSPCHLGDIPNKQQLSIKEYEDETVQSMILKDDDGSNSGTPTEAESSKWFIMTVENDFSEMRFYKKGFFVKYESIFKAISVARLSKKTVRLSSHKCVDKNSIPQFGIYAIPNIRECCVFIGPYEMGDELGVETIKSISEVGITTKAKRTRGFWMNTKTVDNLKVIENPLSFMPSSDLHENEAVPLESHYSDDKNLNEKDPQEILHLKEFDETQQKALLKLDSKKMIKPIKICKTNGFYHLATGNLLKKVKLQSPRKVIINPPLNISTTTITNKSLLLDTHKSTFNVENSTLRLSKVLDVEESPQIKISAVYSQRDVENVKNSRNEKGMFILKPEEINRRLFENQVNTETTLSQEMATDTSGEISSPKSTEYQLFEDQNFEISATLTPYTINEDICIISDDEDDSNNEHEGGDRWKQVLIMCTDVSDIGFIWGRLKYESHLLSFQVPETEYSEFYAEDCAFKNLNSELSKIIGSSKSFDFHWKVIDSLEDVDTKVKPLNFKRLKEILKNQCSETQSLTLISNNLRTYSKNTGSRSCASLVVGSELMTKSSETAGEQS